MCAPFRKSPEMERTFFLNSDWFPFSFDKQFSILWKQRNIVFRLLDRSVDERAKPRNQGSPS